MPPGSLPRWMVLAAFAVGLVLQLLQAWAVGDQRWMVHHVAQFAAGAAVWLLATWPRARGFFRFAALAWLAVMVGAYVLNAFGVLPGPRVPPGQRGGLWFWDPNLLGISLASTAAVAAMLVSRLRWTALLVWGAALTVAVASWTRGATIAILLGAATWAWTRFGWRGRLRLAAGAVALGAAFLLSMRLGPEPWQALFGWGTVERFAGGGVLDPEGTGGVFARLRAHEAAWTIAFATWPWGAGFGGFEETYRQWVEPGARYALTHAHHQVLQLLAEGGFLGLLAWTAPLVAASYRMNARGLWALAPFLAVQGVLWASESPFLFAGAFYATWVALGLARQATTGTWAVRPPCDRRDEAISASPGPPPQ